MFSKRTGAEKAERQARPVEEKAARSRSIVGEWSVRRKVVLVLAVPVGLATVFGGMRVYSELSDAANYSATESRVQVLGPALDYLSAAEDFALARRAATSAKDTRLVTASKAFDAASKSLVAARSDAKLTSAESVQLDKLTTLGGRLHSGQGGVGETTEGQLGELERRVSSLITDIVDQQGDPDPRLQVLNQALAGRLSLAKQQLLKDGASQPPTLLNTVWQSAEIGVEASAIDNLEAALGEDDQVSALRSANSTRLGTASSGRGGTENINPTYFQTYDTLSSKLLTRIDTTLSQRSAAARSHALRDSGIILVLLLTSLVLALAMARQLINSIRTVRRGALDVANVQLPEAVRRIRSGEAPPPVEPIAVHTEEEIGQLARAVEDMHRQALHLASGEAQLRSQVGSMFVTLSRRNTTLVNQQLQLIESLEHDEEDPQRLENLFRLDHLATRMRRNADSLVVLAGTSARTGGGHEELGLVDMLQAAASEVQDYQRVQIASTPDRRIVGRASADVVHLMAEIIDNALSYSSPGTPVLVSAVNTPDGVLVEVTDSGLGMAPDELARANESLKHGAEVTADTARRMGLFVVSRLAEQHDLKVTLRPNEIMGLTAEIVLPNDVLVGGVPQPVALEYLEESAPEVADVTSEPVDVDAEEEVEEEPVDRIEAAIAAVIGLPRRQPGATGAGLAVRESASVNMFDPAPSAPEPVESPVAEREPIPMGSAERLAIEAGHESADAVHDVPEAETTDEEVTEDRDESADQDVDDAVEQEHDDVAAWGERPHLVPVPNDSDAPFVPPAEPDRFETPVADARPQAPVVGQPLSPASALTAALSAEDLADDDTPMFAQLRSNWLSDSGTFERPWVSTEIDAGFEAADRVSAVQPVKHTVTGLPVRRPGNRLVPGGVTAQPTAPVRDPESIRNRLSAHVAGVSRGRAAAAPPLTDDYSHEETAPQ